MILGNAISAIGVGLNAVQKEFAENRDKVETYLAMGASRFEAVKPVGVEALKLALLPTVNQMRSAREQYKVSSAYRLTVSVSSASSRFLVSLVVPSRRALAHDCRHDDWRYRRRQVCRAGSEVAK